MVGKANLPEFAWSVLGQNPWYGTVHNPTHPGQDDRRLARGQRGCARGRALRLRHRLGHGLLDPAAVGRVRDGRAEVALGRDPDRRRLPARARCSTPSARWRARSRTSRCSGRCSPGGGPRAAPRRAHGRPAAAAAGDRRRPRRPRRATRPRAGSADLERLGARVVEARVPDACASTWPLFQHEAARSHARPSRAAPTSTRTDADRSSTPRSA